MARINIVPSVVDGEIVPKKEFLHIHKTRV